MIISRTPFRISFFGGGTDFPAWYRERGGAVLATAIDKYCYLTARHLPPFFEHRIRVVYSKIELCQHLDEIAHPAVREALRFMDVTRGVEIHYDGDLPARSGMGSSSAFTVGLLNALHALRGNVVSRHQLALEGIELEQEILKETVGSQDQVQAAYGGFNHVEFHRNGEISVRPITLPRARVDELNAHLMLFYTGIKRTSGKVADSYVNRMEERARQLGVTRALVDRGIELLDGGGDIAGFGALLHENWEAKRSWSAAVSTPEIDALYTAAMESGALGGKLLGAGGGGFLLLFVPPERAGQVKAGLSHLLHVPFRFEFSGSQIVYFDTEQDYSRVEQERDQNGKVVQFRERQPTGDEAGA